MVDEVAISAVTSVDGSNAASNAGSIDVDQTHTTAALDSNIEGQTQTPPSESAFSTGGRVLDPFRSSLAPTMVEALLCCQNWLRCSQEQIELHEALEEIECYDEVESEFASKVTLDLDIDESLEDDEEEVVHSPVFGS